MARISFHLLILLFTLLAVIAQSKHSQPRIVGGTRATEKVRRHLVNLALYGEGEDSQVCSGTILDRTHILTAAHCLYEDGSTFSYEYSYAYIGQKSFNPSNAEEFYFSRAWIPKRYYRREDSGFDIAVIELDTEIPDNLYYPVTMGDEPKPGRKAIVAGYGLTSTDGDFPNFAMQTRVIARSFDDCENEDELAEEGVLKEKYLVCAVSVGYPSRATQAGLSSSSRKENLFNMGLPPSRTTIVLRKEVFRGMCVCRPLKHRLSVSWTMVGTIGGESFDSPLIASAGQRQVVEKKLPRRCLGHHEIVWKGGVPDFSFLPCSPITWVTSQTIARLFICFVKLYPALFLREMGWHQQNASKERRNELGLKLPHRCI
eukprot:gb/GEZJ01001870.1/.p1 GENE.gb/GEZJ01001870.1/~~gb/GEZJ01001870.1/.p1  ORF type:complete len:372 (-),score=22.55 gb/GEZJ01001870.1/:381-1496(-)